MCIRDSGRPFTDVGELLDTYMSGSAAPSDGALITYTDGELREVKVSDPGQEGLADAFAGFADVSAPTSGVVDTAFGQATFVAIPVSVGDRSGVLLAASLTAAMPVARWVEFQTGVPYIEQLVLPRFELDADGFLKVPTGPGLGIELNPDALAKYSRA